MTICIAALYEGGKGCIMVSDLMTTAHFPIGYEFENDEVEKIVPIDGMKSVYALVSGDVLFADEVISKARTQASSSGVTVVDGVTELLRCAYQEVRKQRIIRNELEARALDVSTYYQNHQRILPNIVQMIDKSFTTYDPQVQFIVAGKGETTNHIFSVVNPGDTVCSDTIGYAAIGSGSPHAVYAMIEGKYKKSMKMEEVEALVMAAKKRSEVAPGVGPGTKIIKV